MLFPNEEHAKLPNINKIFDLKFLWLDIEIKII